MAECARAAGADLVVRSSDATEQLLEARRQALRGQGAAGQATLIDDVGVPRSKLAAMLGGIERSRKEYGVTIATVGHAGDGNVHPSWCSRARTPNAVRPAGPPPRNLPVDTAAGRHDHRRARRRVVEAHLVATARSRTAPTAYTGRSSGPRPAWPAQPRQGHLADFRHARRERMDPVIVDGERRSPRNPGRPGSGFRGFTESPGPFVPPLALVRPAPINHFSGFAGGI